MPASILHELAARESLAALPRSAADCAAAHPDYFFLGAQGPDLFFFYDPLAKREPNLGKLLHRSRVKDWFTAMLLALKERTGEEFEKCLAYALGFCTHLATDALFHPFVYAYLARTSSPPSLHQRIEGDWDVAILRQLDGDEAREHPMPFDPKRIAREEVLTPFLMKTGELFGRRLKRGALGRAYSLFAAYLREMRRARVRVFSLFGLKTHYLRKDPSEEYTADLFSEDGRTFGELFEEAAKRSAETEKAFFEAFNTDMVLPDALFSLHMLTGDPI